jgi:hypothetical protein
MKKDFRVRLSMNPLEVVLLVLILMYLFSYSPTPRFIAAAVDNPLGIVLLFVMVVFLFVYSHPLLGVLFVLVAYKLLSSVAAQEKVAVIDYTPIQTALDPDAIILPQGGTVPAGDDVRFQQYGYQRPPTPGRAGGVIALEPQTNLEVAAVKSMTVSQPLNQDYLDTPFKPVLESDHGAAPA